MKYRKLWFLLCVLVACLCLGYVLYRRGERNRAQEVTIGERHFQAGSVGFRYLGREDLPEDRYITPLQDSLVITERADEANAETEIRRADNGYVVWHGDIGGLGSQVVSYQDTSLLWISHSSLFQRQGLSSASELLLTESIRAYLTDRGQLLSLRYDSLDRVVRFERYDLEHQRRDTLYRLTEGHYNAFAEYRLAYDGVFSEGSGYVAYAPFFLPQIYLFDGLGREQGRLTTIDHVPAPEIAYHDGLFVYKRGYTFRSQLVAQVIGDKVYVFPYRVNRGGRRFVLDVYDLQTRSYEYSIPLDTPEELQPIPEIMAVYFTRDRLYVRLSGEQYVYQIEPRAT